MSQLTEILTQLITNFYVQTSLFGLILAMAIESCCIPLPSELVIPIAGLLLTQGKILPGINPVLGIILIAIAGSVGGLLGSMLAYWIGFKGGRPLMLRYGRYVLISQHDADKADAFFLKYGSATAFFSRLLPVIRTYISLPAGIAKMPFGKFCVYTFAGSLPWCLLMAWIGTIIGSHISTIEPIFKDLDVVILVAVVLLVVWYVWRHIRNDNKARAEHEASVATAAQQQSQSPFSQSQMPQQQWSQDSTQQPSQPQSPRF